MPLFLHIIHFFPTYVRFICLQYVYGFVSMSVCMCVCVFIQLKCPNFSLRIGKMDQSIAYHPTCVFLFTSLNLNSSAQASATASARHALVFTLITQPNCNIPYCIVCWLVGWLASLIDMAYFRRETVRQAVYKTKCLILYKTYCAAHTHTTLSYLMYAHCINGFIHFRTCTHYTYRIDRFHFNHGFPNLKCTPNNFVPCIIYPPKNSTDI